MRYLFLLVTVLIACSNGKKYHDVTENAETSIANQAVDSLDTVSEIKLFQKELNAEYADSEKSPLKPEDRKNFNGLDFFPIDTTYRVLAKFVRTPNETPFGMPTSTERMSVEVKYGELHFVLGGKEMKLSIYQSPGLVNIPEFRDYLFLPFTDETNGSETYGGGRYIDFRIPKGDEMILDFNKAYNPYCAYNEKYSCPIPPAENRLDVPIKAGVRKFKKEE